MPDGRMISKSIATSEQVASVSLLADYLFTRMIPHLDAAGRMPGSPRAVRGIVCPLRDDVTTAKVAAALGELNAVDLIVWYEIDGNQYIEFPKFKVHQRGARFDRESPSRIPDPSDNSRVGPEYSGVGPEDSRETAEDSRETAEDSREMVEALRLSEVKGSEVKGSEVKNRTTPSPTAATGRATWLTPYLSAWKQRFGGDMPTGAAASHLAGPHKEHGADETLRRWTIYLARSEAQFASPARFAATWSEWSGQPTEPPKTGRPARVLSAVEQFG